MEELSEKFLIDVAKKKKISKERAGELVDLCMKMTSAKMGIPFADVYNSIYNVEHLQKCLAASVECSTLTLEQCKEMCSCVIFEEKCHQRYFKDAKRMNEDPDKYVEGMPTEVLSKIVKLAAYLYYNYDGGGLTDNTYDAFEYHLNKRLKMRGKRYEKIGAPPVDKIRTQLPYPMGSLDKVKPGSRELMDFLLRSGLPANNPVGLVWSLKLDGISGLVVYKSGVLSKIYTRGDGTIGGDVTYLKDYIKFPDIKIKNDLVVRGEFILKKDIWEQKYNGSYSVARAFVSGKINSGHITQGLNDIDFVAYEIVDDGMATSADIEKPSKSLKMLEIYGFKTVKNETLLPKSRRDFEKLSQPPTQYDIITIYKSQRQSSEYFIDGLVLTIDEPKPKIYKLGNPKHSVAFKMRLEEQIRETKALGIEWRISRYGKLIPVVIFESVYIDGARLHRASAFNAAHVRDWSLGKGTVLKISRSGDVIPTIVDVKVDPSIEPIFPPTNPTWHWKGRDIVLDDPDSNKIVQIKRIEHFFVTIGVPRLREKTIEKLWDAGYKTIKDITNAKPEDFIKIKGFGKKTSESHFKNIHDVMRRTRLDRYIPASTSLNLGIGRKLVKQLLRFHPTVLEEEPDVIRRMLKKKKIEGFGEKRIENVAANVPKFREFLFSLNEDDIRYAIQKDIERRDMIKVKGFNTKIRGKTFVLTGFFGRVDLDIEDYIYDNLGNFSDTVTSLTEAVIAKSLLEVSKKVEKAVELKIPVLSLEEFVKIYDIKKVSSDSQAEEDDAQAPDDSNDKLGIYDEDEAD